MQRPDGMTRPAPAPNKPENTFAHAPAPGRRRRQEATGSATGNRGCRVGGGAATVTPREGRQNDHANLGMTIRGVIQLP